MKYIFVFRVMMNGDNSVPQISKYYSSLDDIEKEDGMLVSIHPVRYDGCSYDDFLYPEVVQYRNGKFNHYEIGYGYSWLSIVSDTKRVKKIDVSDFIMYKNRAFLSNHDLIDYLERHEGLDYVDVEESGNSSELKRTYANASFTMFKQDIIRQKRKLDDELDEYHRNAGCQP